MKLQLSANRPLRLALFLSLLIHGSLLLPWRHGDWFVQSENDASSLGAARLEVYLQPQSRVADLVSNDTGSIATGQLAQAGDGFVNEENHMEPKTSSASVLPQENIARKESRMGIPLDLLYYYSINELEIRPLIKRQPTLNDTPAGVEIAVNGKALLELLIERDGHINSVNLLQNDLPASHVQQLEQAFSNMEYTPGQKNGRAVRSRLLIEVVYVDGVIHHLPEAPVNLGVFPSAPDPHVPITLPPDRHKRKSNPPLR